MREGFDWLTFSLLAGSAVATATFNRKYHEELNDIMRPTGPGGAVQPWSHAAILVEGLVLATFEADPDAAVSADLDTWRGS